MASLVALRRYSVVTPSPLMISSVTRHRIASSIPFKCCRHPSSGRRSRLLYRFTTRKNIGEHHSSLRCLSRPFSTIALFDPAVFYSPYFKDIDDHTPERRRRSQSSSPTILASSSSSAVKSQKNVLQRFIDWLESVLRNCWDGLLVVIRGSEIVLRFSPLIILTPASILSAQLLHNNYNNNNYVSDFTWWYVTRTMQALGPSFVKLCQWVATRRDIFPPHVCDRLAQLHDRGTPHAWQYTDKTLRQAFGEDYRAKGLLVEPDSVIGCGSAAQVYKGKIVKKKYSSSTGEQIVQERPVAVKVLHPRFQIMVERDLWFLQTVAEWLHSLPFERIKVLNLPHVTANFGAVLHRQADLCVEGENLKQFRSNFYRDENDEAQSSIVFPRPMEGWMSQNVLVEDLVHDAIPIAEYLADASDEGTQVRKELASPLLRAFLKMVFLDNFVHCDLHPGNVLIQTSLVEKEQQPSSSFWNNWGRTTNNEATADDAAAVDGGQLKRTIVFLDAGIATSLHPQEQKNLRDLFRAVILNKGEEAGRLMVERAKYERCSQTPGCVEEFTAGVAELVSEFHDRRKEGLTLGHVRIGSLLSRVLDLCRIHGVEIDPAMASIVISTLVLEGLGRSLEPSLNLIDFAVPFVLGRGRV